MIQNKELYLLAKKIQISPLVQAAFLLINTIPLTFRSLVLLYYCISMDKSPLQTENLGLDIFSGNKSTNYLVL